MDGIEGYKLTGIVVINHLRNTNWTGIWYTSRRFAGIYQFSIYTDAACIFINL